MERRNIYVIPATFKDKQILRFAVCSRMTESRDIQFALEEIRGEAEKILLTTGTDEDILVHNCKTYYNVTRKDCPTNGLTINGITNGQA
jgi:hypothetical protein